MTSLLISKHVNFHTTMPRNKVYGQTHPMWNLSKTGLGWPWLSLLGWISISRSIWKFNEFFRIIAVQMIFILTLLMKVLSIWLVHLIILSQTSRFLVKISWICFRLVSRGISGGRQGFTRQSACLMPILCLLSWPWIMKPSTHRLCELIGLTRMWKTKFGPFQRWPTFGGLDIGWRSAWMV